MFDYDEVMTSLLHPVADFGPIDIGVRDINESLDRMFATAGGSLQPGSCAPLVADLERLGRRVEALKLKVLGRGETAAAAKGDGFADTGGWLARQTRTSRPEAARQARLATDLITAPATERALGAGALSPEHAGVITDALAKLPERVTDEQKARIETELVKKADRFDPAQLRQVARRALEAITPDPELVDAHEDDQIHAEEKAAQDKARFTFRDNADGTVSGHFTVPTLAFAFLRKILEAMTAPRRQGAQNGRPGAADGPVDWAARRGQAFAELLRHLPTDHLHNKTSATVVVQLRDDVLRGALAAAGLDTGQRISSSEARRLACTAGLLPTVLGGRSLPLDLGRTQRLFTEAQRVALSTRHTTCAADDCQRPFAWCEIHHRQPWSHGGPTDLANAVPLCGYHHRRAHAT